MFPGLLNTRPNATLVAAIHRFLPRDARGAKRGIAVVLLLIG